MPRAGLSRPAVVALALAVVDDGGPRGFDDLTLAAVAARAGVAVPSLYKHVAGLPELRRAVVLVALDELTETVLAATADRNGPAAVRAMAAGVRAFAHARPGRYLATQRPIWSGDPDAAALRAASERAVAAIAGTLLELHLPTERTIDAVRAVRAALHGFILLELTGGFGLPDDTGASFDYLVQTLIAGLRAAPSAIGSARQVPEQVGARQHADGIAVVDHEQGVAALEGGARGLDALARADQG